MGYKMKHNKSDFPFKSPVKHTEHEHEHKKEEKSYGADPISAQARLDKAELSFREPGWAKAAGSLWDTVSSVVLPGIGGNGKDKSKKMKKEIIGMQEEGLGEGEMSDVIIDDPSIYG
jgi:hypothetical protein